MFRVLFRVLLASLFLFCNSLFAYTILPLDINLEQFNALPKAEQDAYNDAALNLMRAQCLTEVVDEKIDTDVELGYHRDFGSVLASNLCKFVKAE